MRIKFEYFGEIGTTYSFDKERRVCQIQNDAGEVLTEIDTQIEIVDDYVITDYNVKLLFNNRNDCTEESIYQVKTNGCRIGWIFPIQAIHSIEHKEAENVHFLKYAYVAWQYLLDNCETTVDNYFNLFSCYDETTNILVLDKENCDKVGFEYDKYVISLFDFGYSEVGEGNLFTPPKSLDVAINLKPISADIGCPDYINSLFKNRISMEKNPVSRFYVYYQIIEILITKVFDDLFIDLMKNLENYSGDLFDKRDLLNDYANEKNRLVKLCNEYSNINDIALQNELKDKCIELLEHTKSKTGDQMPNCLYNVRCLLVHRMYVLDKESENILEIIDNLFLELCIILLLSFKTHK